MNLIEITDLEKVYDNDGVLTAALKGVSFTVKEGEFVAIMGPSGSGKSTLLHMLGFLDRHTAGTYRFAGKTIDDFLPDELAGVRNRRMGFVFQAFNLMARLSVLENVKLPLLYSDVPESSWDKKAEAAIASVGLSHRIHHDASKLSGGEKQRAAIARALVMEPEVIFADEPTGNLDSKSGEAVMDILQNLNEEKRHTILLITHETYTAEHAKRIIRIMDGQIESDELVKKRFKAHNHVLK